MAVRKICKQKGCRASPRCDHAWWFDVMHERKRWRMPVDVLAIPRGATEPITSKQVSPVAATNQTNEILTVAGFLDRYFTEYVEAEAIKSAATVAGHLKVLKASLGELPMTALEKPVPIAKFKADYREGRQVATVNRELGVLRAAINWGRFQDPPLLSTTLFHRFGITIRLRTETKRDRRIHRDEEQKMLAACRKMNAVEHKFSGPAMHDRIIGAIETCCRMGEMLGIQNRDIDWTQHQIVIRAGNAKNAENRWIPFDERGFSVLRETAGSARLRPNPNGPLPLAES